MSLLDKNGYVISVTSNIPTQEALIAFNRELIKLTEPCLFNGQKTQEGENEGSAGVINNG